MNTKEFSQYLFRLEQTTLRNEITAILADLFKKTPVKEIDKVCYLVLGQLAPLHRSIEFNLAEKMMIRVLAYAFKRPEKQVLKLFKKVGDLGNIAYQLSANKRVKPLKISELYSGLITIAKQEGTGSQERKIKLFSQLIDKLDPLTTKYIVRIPVGKLRLGFSDLTILDALSWMESGDKSLRPELERAYNVSTDIGLVAKVFKEKGIKGIKKITPRVGIPIRPALAGRLSDSKEIIGKLGIHAVEPKYDGLRVQIHVDKKLSLEENNNSLLFDNQGPHVRIFSRKMDDTTNMFPDIVSTARGLTVESAIFDGEAIGIDPKTKKFLAFQETAQRKRKYDIKKTAKKIPLKVFLFDLLYLNGKPLLEKPFRERRKLLEKVLRNNKDKIINLTPQKIVKNQKEIDKYFQKCVKQGLEGTLSKKLDSPYRAGARNFTWVKHKRAMKSHLADTIDCLVLGYYRGKGKRSSFGIGAFLAGIYDADKKTFSTIAKIGTGLSDDLWKEIRRRVDKIKASEKPKQYQIPKELTPDVWAEPEIVVEIEADEITRSPIHSSKLALRFPRMKRFREKKPIDATSLKEVKNIYNIQRQ